MDSFTINQALCKLLAEELLTQEELDQVKQMFNCNFFLADMSDETRQAIADSTIETINAVFLDAVLDTIGYALKIRYGIQE